MANGEKCVVGVNYEDVTRMVDLALKTVGIGDRQGLNAVAVLLCASELAILLSVDDWCLLEDSSVTIATLRSKAYDSACSVFLQFKDYRRS